MDIDSEYPHKHSEEDDKTRMTIKSKEQKRDNASLSSDVGIYFHFLSTAQPEVFADSFIWRQVFFYSS